MADLDEVAAALGHADRDTRIRAVRELERIGTTAAAEALIRAFQSEDRGFQSAVEDALVAIGTPAVPALVAAVKGDNSFLQWRGTFVLGIGRIGCLPDSSGASLFDAVGLLISGHMLTSGMRPC